ncbi:hypothetical protein CHISP_3515 [Chitinispirillum alkaliphilum]|nr:hypothetical protein CHISP_3515 [Chitinispirillum alkaliphilum]
MLFILISILAPEVSELTQNDIKSDGEIAAYRVDIDEVDSLRFHTALASRRQQDEITKRITDFKMVEKELCGVVEFEKTSDTYQTIRKINFRNGKVYENENYAFDGISFVAYFPDEDVLLGECMHYSCHSYDLTTGKETDEVGNPGLAVSSSSGRFRLNKAFQGQECYHYFVQEKIDGRYRKVIELGEEFERTMYRWLCTNEKAFWVDDCTLFLSVAVYEIEGNWREYFEVKISE